MQSALVRYRLSLGFFIFGLVISGVTAFPLLHELRMLCAILGIQDSADYASYQGLQHWIGFVAYGLEETHSRFPFLAYGTDWLAFGHLVIALFFIGPFVKPKANEWVLYVGLAACAAVIPLALVAGQVRGIPLAWRLIDCSFGVFGAIPLLYCLSLSRGGTIPS